MSTDGLLVVDKPAGWTSHDVVARLRRVFGQKRVGHAGTLDPDATGLLLLGVGRVTRLLRFLSALPKSYTGEVVLGVATSTLDASGAVTATWDIAPSLEDARAAAARLTGDIDQVPPMVSAVKVGGRRLHELARRGEEVERAPRRVRVSRLDVDTTDEPNVFGIHVDCSSGTYVRALAADLGAALGGGAHLRNLRRTAVGRFTIADAVPLEAAGHEHLRPPADAVAHLDRVTLDGPDLESVRHGRRLGMRPAGEGPWAVMDPGGNLIAICEAANGTSIRPAVVVAPR